MRLEWLVGLLVVAVLLHSLFAVEIGALLAAGIGA